MILESAFAFGLMGGANFADLRESRLAVQRGGVERNLLAGPNASRLGLAKGLEMASEITVYHLLRRQSRGAAWVWVGVVVVGNGWMAWHNSRVLPRP